MMLCFQVISSLLCQLPSGSHIGSIEPVSFNTTIKKETQNKEEQLNSKRIILYRRKYGLTNREKAFKEKYLVVYNP